MEPLRPTDPAKVARYRLLRRLGAGGMGVVYLARSPGGALVAVKVIRHSHEYDTGFRARFRREVEAAGRVRSPWVVPLLDAAPDAEQPWLATPFVSGPSLAQAMEECGPLPLASARVLGARLADALDAVHRAGLVHRDVKPGNVLLAPDGPRVIDFGIARAPDDTALTTNGVVVGSPGFLSPEQVRGSGGDIGPASDVFSLGCLLACTVTGARPFGAGPPAAMLMRTVNGEPDLDGVPAELLPLLLACLAKDPRSRPTAADVARTLGGAEPQDAGAWLPEPVSRLVALRSAAALALPAVEATVHRPAAPEPAAGKTPSRAQPGRPTRRAAVAGGVAGLLAAGGTAAWWALTRPSGAASPRSATRPLLRIAVHADLTGEAKAAGHAQLNGARLAVEQFNSRQGRKFDLELQFHDDRGSPGRAREVANRLVSDDRVLAVIGPTTDACATAALDRYEQALLPMVSVSVALDPADVSTVTHRVHVPTRRYDEALAVPIIRYLNRGAGARRPALVIDQAEGDFGWQICDEIYESLRNAGDAPVRHVLAVDADDIRGLRALAGEVTGSGADAVVFTGGYRHAGRLAGALRSAGHTGPRLGTQRAMDPRFFTEAGDAAAGWVFSAAFLDPVDVPSTSAFTAAYRTRFKNGSPPWYAAEAYDATLFLGRAMTALGPSGAERGALVRQLRVTNYRGVTRRLQYEADNVRYNRDGLFLFQARRDRFRCLGQYEDVTA